MGPKTEPETQDEGGDRAQVSLGSSRRGPGPESVLESSTLLQPPLSLKQQFFFYSPPPTQNSLIKEALWFPRFQLKEQRHRAVE